MSCRLVVLISGGGTNLQALIDACQPGGQLEDCEISAVFSNKPEAYGLTRAADAGITTEAINHKDFASRELFDQALAESISRFEPDLVILAGFMRILTPDFVQRFKGKLLNIHPSLLPKYPGLHTHQRAIEANDEYAGATVHFVTEELDGGPAIVQAKVPIYDKDTAELLATRVLEKEHLIFPLAVRWFADKELILKENQAWLHDKKLPESGFIFTD